MRIVVFGASGKVGRRVVRQAASRGHDVIAAVRSGSESRAPRAERSRVCVCDVYEGEGINEALEDADAVVSCLGIKRRNPFNPWSPIRSPRDLTERSTQNILSAMRTRGVDLIACVSAAGVGDSFANAAFPIRVLIRNSNLAPAYRDLEQMESAIRESEFASTALRPTTLLSIGRVRRARQVDSYRLWSCIPRASVARALIDAIEQASTGHATVQIS